MTIDSLKGKGAIVTGAAAGIGRAIAAAFVEAGARVLLCDLDADGLEVACRTLGARALGRVTDVCDEAQVERAMGAARERLGSLDVVVSCAALGADAPLVDLGGEAWRAVQAVTLGGAFHAVKHGARQMIARGRPGVIINVSSAHGWLPGVGQGAHDVARAGIEALTRCAALELAARGIRVVGLAPGRAELPRTKRAVQAEEIAGAAVYLASDAARDITGETWLIDGGAAPREQAALREARGA